MGTLARNELIDRRTRKNMTLNDTLEPKSNTDKLYLPRSKEERTNRMRNMYQK